MTAFMLVNTPKVGGTTTPVFAGVWRALSFL